ncbi:unnamed protein product, partial [Echinostoma caproni]|uniref:Rab-like protein 3 n=1 Tax=Echinostoma caproni TaxID=27848 RepID=A0A183AQF5_9TREM
EVYKLPQKPQLFIYISEEYQLNCLAEFWCIKYSCDIKNKFILILVVVGPSECGKSYVCNFLSDAIEQVTVDYKPTKVYQRFLLRTIIEYEQSVNCKGKNLKVELELWDVSGSNSYENCWPALFKNVNGAVFVYNPNQPDHGKILEDKSFPQLSKFITDFDLRCIMFYTCTPAPEGFCLRRSLIGPVGGLYMLPLFQHCLKSRVKTSIIPQKFAELPPVLQPGNIGRSVDDVRPELRVS